MFARITVKTAATGDALSLADAKAHMRVEHADEDTLIQASIKAAVSVVESHCGVSVLSRTLTARLDGFSSPLLLRRGPVTAVNSVSYRDADGALQTLAAGLYQFSPDRVRARLAPVTGESWPATQSAMDAVSVEYVAGWAEDAVPEPIVHALKLLVAHYYENREPIDIGNITTELPFTVTALLSQFTDHVLD